MLIRWCRTDICSYKFFEKVSLILGNPFLVPSLCKLNHMYQRLFHPDQHEIIWHIEYFFFTFCPAIIWTWETSLEDWKMLILWCRTDICSCKLSAKVSLMLDNPFLVPSLCKLNHISVCFIQISTKSAYSLLESNVFFWSHPRCFGPLGKFQHNIKISIKTARVSKLSFCFLWLWFE